MIVLVKRSSRTEPARTAEPDTGYVDASICAKCHRDVAESYAKTGMARSFYRPDRTITDHPEVTYYHKASDSYFQMFRRDGRYFQRRYQIGFDGEKGNSLEKEVHYVIGSGNHVRTYLHRTPRGELIQLPLAWYAEDGGHWAMNPGYDRPDHPGFQRRLSQGCMFCHDSYPLEATGIDETRGEPLFRGDLPQGIDCQRCHGPGRQHVREAGRGGATLAAIRGAIVNPSRLSDEAQMEVCMQCHLETTSFRLPNAIVRYDRSFFSYRPGEPLGNFVLHFDHAPATGRDDKFEIVSAAYRLRRSLCFQKSDGALRCTTCHDPHRSARDPGEKEKYSQVCRKCHAGNLTELAAAGRHPQSGECVECHMPKRRTEDVVHVTMTDHFIQRKKAARNLLSKRPERHETPEHSYRGEVVLYYPNGQKARPEDELYLAVAQVNQSSNLDAGIPRLKAAIEKYRPREPEHYLELADALRNSGQLEKALPYYEEALRRRPTFLPAFRKYALCLRSLGQADRSISVLRQALKIAADDAVSWHELGLAHLQRGEREPAVSAFQKAIELDPEMPEAQNSLGGVLLESGDRAGAEAAFRKAIQIQPHYVEAHSNLGNLFSTSGDFEQARYHLEAALRFQPASSSTRYNYAIALIRVRRFDEARRQIEAALAADPKMAEAHEILANLLVAKGQVADAIVHYREAVRIQPARARAHLDLATLLVHSGETTAALLHLRQASNSPDSAVRQEALRLIQQLGATPQ